MDLIDTFKDALNLLNNPGFLMSSLLGVSALK